MALASFVPSCGPAPTQAPTPPAPAAAVQAAPTPAAPAAVDGKPPTTAEVVARCEPAVALIRGKDGSGTGFLIRPGLLVTNAHVLDGEVVQDLEVHFPSAPQGEKGPLSADLVYEDFKRDLAVLSVKTGLAPLELAASHSYRKGDDVLTIGNPGAGGKVVLENAVSRGVLSSPTEIDGQAFHQLGMSVNPGNSGGPVLDPNGRVIGVVALRLSNAEAVAFCVPLDDLRAAVESADARAKELARGKPAGSAVPALAYKWEPGATLVYSVKLDLDLGKQVQTTEGSSIYKVQSVSGESVTLKHRGWLSTRVRDKGDASTPSPGPANPVEGTVEIDPRGHVLKSEGSTPVPMLGDLSLLVLEPLPERPKASWDVVHDVALQRTEVHQVHAGGGPIGLPGFRHDRGRLGGGLAGRSPFPPRGGGRRGRFPGGGRPQPAPAQRTVEVTTWPAQEQTSYAVGPQDADGSYPVRKTYRLRTREANEGGEPRLAMTGGGTIAFDPKRGAPRAVSYKGNVVYNAENVTVRIPLTLTCRLLEGAERDRALVVPTLPATANRPIDAKGIDQALADLASGDDGRRGNAARTLGEAAPVEDRRKEVAAALVKCLDLPNHDLHAAAARALGVWGDESTRAPLIERLNAPDYGALGELTESLARLGPDERSAAALVAALPKDARLAGNALRAMGPVAEEPLLTFIETPAPGDPNPRVEAVRILAAVGTPRSLDRLRAVAAHRQDGRLGQVAADVVRRLDERYPGDEAIGRLLADLASDDANRRRAAVERLAKAAPVDPLRDKAARAFAASLNEPDDHMAIWSVRGLASWGGPDARSTLAKAVGDGRFRPWREALEALAKIGPGPDAVDPLMTRLKDDAGLVLRTLTALGPPAEPALLTLLDHKDFGIRREACRALGAVGTAKSIPPLEAVAKKNEDVFSMHEAAAALKALRGRLEAGPEVDALIASLRSGDRGREDEALRRLAVLKPDDARRADVSRALDKFLTDDVFRMEAAARAAARWADDRARGKLVGLVNQPGFRSWGHVANALVASDPDDATLRAVVARFKDDRGLVGNALRALGARAERTLLGLVGDASQPPDVRVDALGVLAEVGTPASLGPLRTIAAHAGDEPVAATAEEAVKAIEDRS